MPDAQKVTFREMRQADATGVEVFGSKYKCAHSITVLSPAWGELQRPILDVSDKVKQLGLSFRAFGRLEA